MATTQSSAFSSALVTSVQSEVLTNLRDKLIWANPKWAEEGTFNAQSDTLTFTSVPDLTYTSALTPLTEGTRPTPRAISMNTLTISTAQYGDVVGLTDVAKLKGPKGIEATATERITRVGLQVIDRITRDAIFLGGTPFFPNTETSRSGLDNNDYVISTDLQKLYSTMRKNLVPTFDDGSYMLFVSEEVAYDLKRDSTSGNNWIEINKYTTTEPIMSGEIGKYHGFRIVPTTTNPTVSSSVTVSLSLAVGNIKGWGAGNLQTFRTYHKAPGGDHDDLLEQEELMGWKVMFGVATLNNDYYYRLESYASTL